MNQTRLRIADQMTRAQALRLKQLSEEACQPRQFEPNLTAKERQRKRCAGSRRWSGKSRWRIRSKSMIRKSAQRFSLATNAMRLRGDHAQSKI